MSPSDPGGVPGEGASSLCKNACAVADFVSCNFWRFNVLAPVLVKFLSLQTLSSAF